MRAADPEAKARELTGADEGTREHAAAVGAAGSAWIGCRDARSTAAVVCDPRRHAGQDLRHHEPRRRARRRCASARGRLASSTPSRARGAASPPSRLRSGRRCGGAARSSGSSSTRRSTRSARAVEDAQPDDRPAQRRRGPGLLHRGRPAHRRQGDQGDPRLQRGRHPRRRGLPHRLPPLRHATARALRAGRARASTGTCCAERRSSVPAILAGGLTPGQRRRGDRDRRSPTRSTSPAASRPSPAARTTRRWPPSSRPPAAGAGGRADERRRMTRRRRGALRPLRRPLRARDADRRRSTS